MCRNPGNRLNASLSTTVCYASVDMTASLATPRVIAVELRHADTGAMLGVALIAPSERHAVMRREGAGKPAERTLTSDAWLEIDAWIAAGDAGLPARPSPLNPAIAAALLQDGLPVVGRRLASIPLTSASARR